MPKLYTLLKDGEFYKSRRKGQYAGYAPGRIFGWPDETCKSGMRMKPENRVWFLTLEDAVNEGYRPCMNCRPINEDDFEEIRHLVPEKSLKAFYERDKKG